MILLIGVQARVEADKLLVPGQSGVVFSSARLAVVVSCGLKRRDTVVVLLHRRTLSKYVRAKTVPIRDASRLSPIMWEGSLRASILYL